MQKVTFTGHYIGLDVRTGALAIVPDRIRVEKPDDRGHVRTRDLDRDRAAKEVHELLGEGKTRRYLTISIEEVSR